MSRAASRGLKDALVLCRRELLPVQGQAAVFRRDIGGLDYGVPEHWGRKSPYTPGTDFLGTPENHLDLASKRPVSPHVFEIDGKHTHYKFPAPAVSSILNRVTGCVLSVGTAGLGAVALSGDVAATVEALKAYSLIAFMVKAGVSFPLVYHYLGGVRHIIWDHSKIGNQADKSSLLEISSVRTQSKVLIGGSAAASLLLALYSI